MAQLQEALRMYLFLIPLTVLFLSEIAKFLVDRMRTGLWRATLFATGGMPSSHSAFVTSLLIVVGRKLGMDSVEFAIVAVLAGIVWYDAMNIRHAVGQQAHVLNQLQDWKKLSERMGHSFFEVLVGIVFGAVVTLLGMWLS